MLFGAGAKPRAINTGCIYMLARLDAWRYLSLRVPTSLLRKADDSGRNSLHLAIATIQVGSTIILRVSMKLERVGTAFLIGRPEGKQAKNNTCT